MQTFEQIHDALQAAEKATEADSCKAHLLTARTILAEAVAAGESPDRTRLEQLLVRAGSQARKFLHRGRARDGKRGIAWGSLVNAIVDYLERGGVPMPDGSVATKHGWSGAPNEF